MKSLLIVLFGITGLTGCASEPKAQPKVHPAAMGSENYFIDNGMPIREVKEEQDFFFKKCNVDNSGPYPTKTTYDCNEP